MKKMNLKKYIAVFSLLTQVISVSAADFFSTEPATTLFNIGARIGGNMSNRTISSKPFNAWNVNSWGSGFDIGAVANINFRDYLSVQPGIFFESRSGNYSYATDYITSNLSTDTFYQLGHTKSYYITIPVMGVVGFNVLDELRWLVELGPYFQFRLHASDGKRIVVPVLTSTNVLYTRDTAKTNFADVGIKMGTGLKLWNHYYFGIHYLAGMCNAWSFPGGGRNKAWTFTLGYDF